MEELSKQELEAQRRYEAFQELIGLVLDLDPKKYAQPWSDEMLFTMRNLLTKNVKNFPVKARPYIELFKKYLFDNSQLIAMAALAHSKATEKREREDSLLVRPSFEDIAKVKK